ncbi:MAG: ubiquitin-like domain-containing protein [Anaerolineales bacterium]|nr:ubiquitin-like domain-containing protein [Anaerolineales bacterium]
MKSFLRLILAVVVFSTASCQPKVSQNAIQIVDGDQVYTLATAERLPSKLLAEANISLSPTDRLLYLGQSIPLDQPLPEAKSYTLQVRRAVALTLVKPDGQQTIQTSAFTVGQALTEAGISLYAADRLDPPAEAPINGPLTVTYTPSREYTVSVDGKSLVIRSAAATVGQALAQAGIPLEGLDTSLPSESALLPEDGQIRITRVVETVTLSQKSIPFTSRFEASADLELDQQSLLQGGEPGLAMSRVRIRYEDGQEVGRQAESESVVRPALDRVVGFGTKVVIRSTSVDGVAIQYWRALRVYTTSYSPCRSGGERCYYGTSSGKLVQKGVVAVVARWWAYMVGQPIYVPGYGYATIEDIGGGFPDRYWIDLGWSDSDYQPMTGWTTIYFLTPVPDKILYTLPYR